MLIKIARFLGRKQETINKNMSSLCNYYLQQLLRLVKILLKTLGKVLVAIDSHWHPMPTNPLMVIFYMGSYVMIHNIVSGFFRRFSTCMWQNTHLNVIRHVIVCDVYFFSKFYNFIKEIVCIYIKLENIKTIVFKHSILPPFCRGA